MKHPFILRLALYGWRIGLVFGALSLVLVAALGSPTTVKNALKSSGAYEVLSKHVVATVSNETLSGLGGAVPGVATGASAATSVQQAANQTFNPQAARTTAEKLVDDTYAWLRGDSPELRLKVDTAPYTEAYARNLAGRLAEQTTSQSLDEARAKPACSQAQLQQLSSRLQAVETGGADNLAGLGAAFDSLPCSPLAGASASVRQEVSQLVGDTAENNDVLTGAIRQQVDEGVARQFNGLVPARDIAIIPTIFQWLLWAPWLFAGLALLSAAAVWRLAGERRFAIHRLARSLLGAGITLAVLALLSRLAMYLLGRPDGALAGIVGNEFGGIFVRFISEVAARIDGPLLSWGIVYMLAAALALTVLRRQQPPAPDASDTLAVPAGPATTTATPTTAVKPTDATPPFTGTSQRQ